jgi:poly(3-hydroxybutyrate) depolymerase
MQTLNQQSFLPSGASSLGVAPNAYAYIPSACQSGSLCGLHVSFHGCNQNYESADDAYYGNGGFNTWAESNNLIVLYPQAASDQSANPEGCFDWWGFTGSDYAYKTGVQTATTWNMIEYLASSNTTFAL